MEPLHDPLPTRPDGRRSVVPLSLVSLASLTMFSPALEAGPLRDGPLARLVSGGGPCATAGRAHTLQYEKTVQVDADFDRVLRYFAYLDAGREECRNERLSYMKRSMEDHQTRFIGIDPTPVEGGYSVAARAGNGRTLRAGLPNVLTEIFVPAQRGGTTYRVAVRQEKFVELEGPAGVRAFSVRSEVNQVMEPHWRFGVGPQATTVRIARAVTHDGKPCTLLSVKSTLSVETHGLLGRNMILDRAAGTFHARCEGLLARNAALLYEKSRDQKLHASPLEMLVNGRKLLEVK